MNAITQQYNNLDRAIDEVRLLLEEWLEQQEEAASQGGKGAPAEGKSPGGRSGRAPRDSESAGDAAQAEDPSRAADASESGEGGQALRYAQLVLHEWLANLMQHADFRGRTPYVEVHICADETHIFCAVVDNSDGFDLAAHLDAQRSAAQALPERGMGLRIISACTDDFTYHTADDGKQRFEFSIPADHDPWLSMLF
jgi:serine/threonine-protein kinase RsbW